MGSVIHDKLITYTHFEIESANHEKPVPINSISRPIFIKNILTYLGANDLAATSLTARELYFCYRETGRQRALTLIRFENATKLLSTFGVIVPTETLLSVAKAHWFLMNTIERCKLINKGLPKGLKTSLPIKDLVVRDSLESLKNFLKIEEDHSLEGSLSDLAGIPAENDTSLVSVASVALLKKNVHLIKKWLKKPSNTSQISALNLNEPLTCLPKEVFSLTLLKEFVLHSSLLTAIPAAIGNLTLLESLELSENELLSSLPPEIGNLTLLKRLELSKNNQLRILPSEIGKLTLLKELTLDDNELKLVPDQIGTLTKLQYLSLRSNQLTSLPPGISNLVLLNELYLSQNQFMSIPDEIRMLTALENLSLHSNQLTSIPTWIGNLSTLESLSLSSNKLTSIPHEIGRLTALKRLYLAQNPLREVPVEMGDLTALESLSLFDSHSSQIPPTILRLRQIRHFSLKHTQYLSTFDCAAAIFRKIANKFSTSNSPS